MKSLTENQLREMLEKAYQQGCSDMAICADGEIDEQYIEECVTCKNEMFTRLISEV